MTDSSQPTGQTSNQPDAPAATAAATAAPSTAETAAVVSAPALAPDKTDAPATASATAPATGDQKQEATQPTDKPVAPAIPERYEFKIPKGDAYKDASLDEHFAQAITPALKEAGVTQEALDKIFPAFVDFQRGQVNAMMARDLEATMKDPTLGKMNWGKTQGFVNTALAAFTTPEFRTQLNRWGIANNLEFVRVFASIGKAMASDVAERGQPTSAEQESRADRMYGRAKKVGNGND